MSNESRLVHQEHLLQNPSSWWIPSCCYDDHITDGIGTPSLWRRGISDS